MSQVFTRRTPETEALQQEQAATSVMDQQAAEQDFIKKQQKDAQKAQQVAEAAAADAARAQKAQIAAAKNAGVKIQTDASGQDTMARHEDGAPLYESGFTSEPQQGKDGPSVQYRDPRGKRYDVPVSAINRTTDPTGSPFYEFQLDGQTVRQPEDKAKPLFKVDPATGQRYTEAPDTKTGSFTQTPLGLDRDAAAKAAIEKRKLAAKQQQDERSFQADEIRLQQDQQQTALKPVKDRLDIATDAFDKLEKAKTRYEKRPEGIVSIQKFGDEEIASPIDSNDATRLSTAQAWIEQHTRTKQELEAAKAAHDPIAATIQEMQVKRDKLALDTLHANRREALELEQMERAAKAGIPVHEADWKKRLADARRDPRIVDTFTKAALADAGSPLADDVERVNLSETGKLMSRVLNTGMTGKTMQPGQGVLQPTEKTPLSRPKPTLKDTILENLAADNLPATSKDANALATNALGITDPDKWSVTANEQGTHDLSRDGQLVGTVDTRNNQIRLFPPTTWEQENEQVRISNANKDGLPIYYMGGSQPMRSQELRDYIQGGFDIATTTNDPVELETKLAAAGLSPNAIRRNVMAGRLSVQDGKLLNEKFHGLTETDTSEAGTRKAFGEWLTKPENRTQAALFASGDPAQKAEVMSGFLDQHISQASTNLLPNREGFSKQREAMLKPFTEKGMLSKAGGFMKELVMPMIGIGAQGVALPFQEALHLFGAETEAGKLSNEEFSNWLKRSSGFLHRINSRNDLDRPLGDLETWMNTANPGDDVPQELADRIAAAAYDTYHQLTPDSAKDLNTTRDTFDVNKDPALRGIVQNYLQTANPSARASLLGMLTMDARDRETQKKVMAYIEAPRTASASEAQERAALAGVTLTPEKAGQLLALGKQLEAADTPAKAQNLMRQAGGLMGLSNPEDAKTAFDLITRKTSTNPDSAMGLLKGGFVAGRQELATEALTTAAEVGVGFLTAGAAVPEIAAERTARQGIMAGARAAIKRTLNAGLDALSAESKMFAAARGKLGQARRAVGEVITKEADDFAKLGIVQPKFGAPLTTGQKTRNIAVAGVKAGAAAAPIESLEEGVAAMGDTDPNLDSLVQQMGMGAAGGMVLGPLFTAGGAASQAWKNRGLDARMSDIKTKWAEDFNKNMAGVPGFKPMRPEDFDVAMSVMNTPEHAAARDEYVNALAELQTAAQEHANSPSGRLREIQSRLAELEKQHGPREKPIGGVFANGMESLRAETIEEKRLLAEQAALMNDPASIAGKSSRLMAAEARAAKAGNDLVDASTFAFEAADELRQLPADQQPLYTGIAKAMSGAREFTEPEAKALIGLQGDNAVAFQQAMPADVAGPPSSTKNAPTVTETGPGRYTLPEGVRIAVPPQAVAMLGERAPSLVGALARSQDVATTQTQVTGGAATSAVGLNPSQNTPATQSNSNTTHNLDSMSQADFAAWLKSSQTGKAVFDIINKASAAGTMALGQRGIYALLTARPELRQQMINDILNGVQNTHDAAKVAADYAAYGKVMANEQNTALHRDGNPDWTGTTIGKDVKPTGTQVRHKSYVTLASASLAQLRQAPAAFFNGLEAALKAAGFNGQMKMPVKWGRLESNFDNIVMHGATEADAKLGAQVAEQYVASQGMAVAGVHFGQDAKGTSHTDLIATDVAQHLLQAPAATFTKGTTNESATNKRARKTGNATNQPKGSTAGQGGADAGAPVEAQLTPAPPAKGVNGVAIDNADSLIQNGGGVVEVSQNGRKVSYDKFGITIDGNTAEVAFVELAQAERGKGIGLSAYEALGKELAARGITLQSSKAQYSDGRKLWEKLASKGLATKGAQGVYKFTPPAANTSAQTTPNGQLTPKAHENIARQVIGTVAAKSPKLKKLIQESKQPSTMQSGGMWTGFDGTIVFHMPSLVKQLAGLDAKTAAKRVEAILDEEIRHSANLEAARRLYKRGGTNPLNLPFEQWREAWYGDIWNNHFTDAMRQQVMDAYGDTLPKEDWMRAMEGLRMLDQLRATNSITEAVLRHLEAVLQALREFLANATPAVKREIEAIQAILIEYGYEAGSVKPEKAKKQAKQPKAKKPAPAVANTTAEAPKAQDSAENAPLNTPNAVPESNATPNIQQDAGDKALSDAFAGLFSAPGYQSPPGLFDAASKLRGDNVQRESLDLFDAVERIEAFYADPEDSENWPEDIQERWNDDPVRLAVENGDLDEIEESNPALHASMKREEELNDEIDAARAAVNRLGKDEYWSKASPGARDRFMAAADGSGTITQAQSEILHATNEAIVRATIPADVLAEYDRLRASNQAAFEAQFESYQAQVRARAADTVRQIETTGRYRWDASKQEFKELDEPNVLFAAPAPVTQTDIPKERREAIMKAAGVLIDLGVKTPQELAARLDKLAPNGALRQYSRAFWRVMSGFDSTLEESPDWQGVYAAMDKPAEPSAKEQDEANRLAGIRLEERFNREFEQSRPKIEALFDEEGKTWVVKNGKIAKPGGIQERWTPDELNQMVARFRDAGLAASVTGSSGQSMKSTFALIDTDSQRMFGIVMNERAAKASAEAKLEAQRQDQAKKQGYLAEADQDALQWMNQTFGEDFANEYNKKELADFLTGKAPKFSGMVSQRWTDGVKALGAIADAEKGTVDFTAIKKAYNASKSAEADTPATAEAKVEEQVQTVAATEGQRDAKEIKTDIMAALEKALSERDPAKVKLVTFDIPGDGTFKIFDSAENIKNLMSRVKRLPTQITPENAPTVPNTTNLQGLANAVERAGDSGDILAWVTNAANADEWAMKVVAAVRAKNAGLVQRAESRLAERTAERPAAIETPQPEAPKAAASARKPRADQAASTTEDAGAELTYNRRNRVRGGIKWQDIKDKTPTLRISETKKVNVYPKPDYEQLVEDGMPVIIAHVVKQVYDSIAITPALSRTPTDADLQTYIDTVNKIMDGVMSWTANPEAVKAWVDSTLKQAGAMISRGPINITDMVARPKVTLLEIAFPNWKDNREALRMAGGNKVLGALQPGTDEAQKAVKDIGAGWPAKQEAWSKQGYRVINRDDLTLKEYNKTVVEIDGRTLQYFDTQQQAQEFITSLKPFLVIDKVRRIKGQADTQEAATELAREIVKRAKKEPQIDTKGMSVQAAEREGESRRMEGEDITSEKLRETFGFKGINFGNWMKGDSNQAERQLHLNHAYDSFMDMADILGVPPKAMSLNGLLGIAFGAQGSGGNFAAHFVPGVNEINLTRTSGAGSLAHEWAHGLDHYFAVKGGLIRDSRENRAFLSEHVFSVDADGMTKRIVDGKSQKVPAFPGIRPEVVAKFRDIVRSMRKRRETPDETAAKVKAADERTAKNIESWLKSIKSDFMREKVDETAFDALAERIRKGELGDGMVAASRNSYLYPAIAEMRDLYKAKTGRVYSLSQAEGLNNNVRSQEYGRKAENAAKRHEPQDVNTDYYRAAIKMDKDKGGRAYWATDLEMFARAFDAYVSDTLEAKAAKNTYLSHAGRNDETTPANQERETIKNAFQSLIETLDTEETEQGVALYAAPRYQSPPGLADTAQRLKGSTAAPHLVGSIIAKAYAGVQRGRSSVMVPIRAVWMVAKAAHPELTPAAFMAQINAMNEAGSVLIGLSETMTAVEAAGPFRVGGAGTEMAIQPQSAGEAISSLPPSAFTDFIPEDLQRAQTDRAKLTPAQIAADGELQTIRIVFDPNQIKSADPITRDQQGNVIPLSQRFNPESNSILFAAPRPDDAKAKAIKEAIATMPPMWREALELSMKGTPPAEIAQKMGRSETAVGNLLNVANGRLRILLAASEGKLKPTVQVENDKVKAASGRPDLAMSGNAAFAAVDQRRSTPQEVTHGEMEELASRMFATDPTAAENLVVRWMDSGTTVLSTDGMPDAIKAIVGEAQARSAAEMLMTAAAKLLVTEKALAGGNTIQLARLIDLYRNTGTEQARALNMRYDPQATPEERAAMYLSEALLTPPEAMRNEIRRNPANKEKILAAWAAEAEKLKEQLKAEGYDIDATFRELAKERKLAEAAIPQEVKIPLARANGKTRKLVKSVLEGMSWGEAAAAAKMTLEAARKAYMAFRESLNQAGIQAAQAVKDALLRSAPAADFATQLGLPEWLENASPDYVPVKTEATQALKEQRTKKKVGGEIDLKNPVAVARLVNRVSTHKSTTFDKFSEYWRASILSGPQTHVVNVVSGVTFGLYESTFKKLSAGVQGDIARMFGMKPDAASLADIPSMIAAVLPSIKQAFANGVSAFKEDSRVFDNYAMSIMDNNGGVFKEQSNAAIKGKKGEIIRLPFRLMGAADEFVKSFFTRIEVAAQARQIARNENLSGDALRLRIAELMEVGSPAWERALAGSKRITFQNEEISINGVPVKLNSPLTAGSRAIDAIDGAAKLIKRVKKGDFGVPLRGLSHFVFPFVDTPTNIFKMGVQMSPVGGLLSIIDAMRYYNLRRKGNVEEAQKIYNAARAFDDLTNQIIAWGFILALSELVKPGDDDEELPYITGTMPWRTTAPGEREIAYRVAPPQSIRIGGKWISYKRLDPFASALAFTVDSIKEFTSGKPVDENWGNIGMNMMRNLQDKTFMQGVSDLFNAINDPERFGTKWAVNIATGFVPNLIRQPRRTQDPLIRESDIPNDMGFWDALARRVGYSVNPQGAMPAVDVWGREQAKNTGTGSPNTDWMLRLFSPADMKDAEGVDHLDVLLQRYNQTHDKPFGVTAPSREIQKTINGKPVRVSLDDAEYDAMTRKAGQAARTAIGDRFKGRDLTETDVDLIKEIISRAQAAYRDAAFAQAFQKRGLAELTTQAPNAPVSGPADASVPASPAPSWPAHE